MRTNHDAIEGERSRGLTVIAVSLGIAVFSTSFAIDAFRSERAPERSGAVAPDGPVGNGSIYFQAENDQGQSMSGIVEPDGSAERDAFPGDPAAQHQQFSFSPDGTRLAYVDGRDGHRGIYVANADGSNAVRLTDQVNDSWPSWSPDGTKIAFVGTRFDPTIDFCQPGGGLLGCPTDIYTMGADGSNVTDVTDDPGFEFDPTWSPDGAKIAFASTSDVAAPTTITIMNADGTGRTKMSPSTGGSDFHPSWSPDGTQIVFGGIHHEDWGLFEVRADGTDERTLLFGMGTRAVAPAWSPDGSLIAFGGNVGDYGQPEGIFAMHPDGSGITKLAESPDGWAVYEIAWRPPISVSPSPMNAPHASVTGVFDVGLSGQVTGLAYGLGSLWVEGYENPTGPGHVIRLDPETGAQLADIAIGPVAPGFEVGGGGMAIGEGAVWVVGTAQSEGGVDTVLVKIDPATDRVVDTVDLGGKVADDVAVDENGVWVLFGGDDDKMAVARVDPMTDQVVARIPLAQAYGHFIFSFDGAIVAMTNQTTDTMIGNSVINVIDPSTDTVTTSVPLGDSVWPAAGDDAVWASTGATLERIGPCSGEVWGTWPLVSTGDSLSVGAGGVWSVSPMGRATVSRWNPALQAVDLSVGLPAGAGANVIATSPDAVWVLSFEGSITRVQLGAG